MRTSMLFLSLFVIPFNVLAESRLDRIRDFYEATTQKHAKELIQTATKNIELKVEERTNAVKKIHKFSDSLMNSINMIAFESQTSSQFKYQEALSNLLNVEKQLRDEAKKLSDSNDDWLAAANQMRKEDELIEQVSADGFCHTQLDAAPLHLPELTFPSFEEIDLSNLPEPKYKGISGVPGRTDDDSDLAVESGFMMASTTAGSAIGGTIGSVLPGIGTVIGAFLGAGVGALVGYCGGKGAVATKVALENQELRRAYHEACAREEQRQRQEIERARSFIAQNPLTKEVIKAKASAFCAQDTWRKILQDPMSQLADLQRQVHYQLNKIESLIHEKALHRDTQKALLMETSKELEARGIAELTTAVTRPLLAELNRLEQQQRILDLHEKAESTLFRCITDPQLLCAEKEACFFSTASQLKEAIASFFLEIAASEELKKFQVEDWGSRVDIYVNAITNCVR